VSKPSGSVTGTVDDAAVEPDEPPAPPAIDDPRLTTWRAFLYAQSTLIPRLDAELRRSSGLTLAEFDALAQLAFAPDQRLRMSDLAERVLLSRSGVTRLVDRLERDGDVRRESCAPDGRGAYAVLTERGRGRVRGAMPRHLATVDAHFLEHIEPDEFDQLTAALARVARANGRPVPSEQASIAAMRRVVD
jgi:DNA-binding MarR family transcriptional regulator